MKTSTAIAVLAALVAVIGIGWWLGTSRQQTPPPQGGTTATSTEPQLAVALACNGGKSIGAAFYQGSVTLQLSDKRTMTLPQVQSASGARYANEDQSIVFWGKGNTAFITEGPEQTQTFSGCIAVKPDPTNTLTQILATSTLGISIRFPQGYTLDQKYVYQALGPGKGIHGIKLTIPPGATTGTNLSKDSYISVEELPSASDCTGAAFLDVKKTTNFSDADVVYSVATTTDAAAGNIYDEAVFAIPGSSPCTAVRYFIHSGNIHNYPDGTVQEFDKAGIIGEFDNIRRSLVLGR
jgi:membrane-bound inhibitor of C-type lysozyme